MTRIKICGIANEGDALKAAELGADALGFILYEESPRYIPQDLICEIGAKLPPYITTVGVFVNEPVERVNEIAALCRFDYVQLSGDEPPEFCRQVHRKVVKAVRIDDHTDMSVLSEYAVSAYLLDTAVTGQYGGTGRTFDWKKAIAAKKYGRIILAGGLTPGNLRTAIETAAPDGVDISSGVEVSPGHKDYKKMREVIDIAHSHST